MHELPTQYQQFIHRSRYARYLPDKKRRETWAETVDRYLDFILRGVPQSVYSLRSELREAILKCDVMPSMRAMMMAGPAAEQCNVGLYNCSYTPMSVSLDKPRRFSEILYILMAGTGVGFSCEQKDVDQLPDIKYELYGAVTEVHVIEDSTLGWVKAYEFCIESLFDGFIPRFDYTLIRPKGARLKTKGGRASGPDPLRDLIEFTINTFKCAGTRLTSMQVHDIVCKIGDVVVVGGVRRSALISLSDLSNSELAGAKAGAWWEAHPHRRLANNSAVYESKPDLVTFMREWTALVASGSGERGIFNRDAARMLCRRIGRDPSYAWGTNPCSEIILRPYQFCNLSEVVIRSGDSFHDIDYKVQIATILGTLQARFTDFKYLSPEWKQNTEEEALLGVSLTGVYDRARLTKRELGTLRFNARNTNVVFAKKLGIKPAAANTCIKPSGTVSQLVDCASGMHTRHAPFYIRRVRGDRKDSMTQFMIDQGVPHEACQFDPNNTVVFSFPMKSPEGSRVRDDLTAIEHLNDWLHYQEHWCDHKPSVTISVKDDEWMDVGAWVYRNFDWVSGVSFLPHDGGTYVQAPYEDITAETYEQLAGAMPDIDWSKFVEEDDNTTGTQTLACTAGVCELVNI